MERRTAYTATMSFRIFSFLLRWTNGCRPFPNKLSASVSPIRIREFRRERDLDKSVTWKNSRDSEPRQGKPNSIVLVPREDAKPYLLRALRNRCLPFNRRWYAAPAPLPSRRLESQSPIESRCRSRYIARSMVIAGRFDYRSTFRRFKYIKCATR